MERLREENKKVTAKNRRKGGYLEKKRQLKKVDEGRVIKR